MLCSQSLSFVSQRTSRAVSRSKSMGSGSAIASRSSKFDSQSYREMIPMIGEGEFKDFKELQSNAPMTNDVRSVKSVAKSASSTLWHPTSSLVNDGEENLESVSSTAVMVQPVSRTPSRNVSATSFHSGTGPIVVAPVDSIKFVGSSNEKTEEGSNETSSTETVKQRISGTDPGDDVLPQ